MHAIQLLEIGKCFATGCTTSATLRSEPSDRACQDYWLANRFRHESWIKHIRHHQEEVQKVSVRQRVQLWRDVVPLLQEILLTEPVTRTVACHGKWMEELGIESELTFAAQSTFTSHLEARMRCLNLMVFGFGIPAELVRQLNHIRLTCESYNDQMLSLMTSVRGQESSSVDPWSFRPAKHTRLTRASCSAEAATSLGYSLNQVRSQWLSNWFLRSCALELDYRTYSAEHNADIAKGLLGLLGTESFDSLGLLKSPSFARLSFPSSEQAPVLTPECSDPDLLTWEFDTVSNNAAASGDPAKNAASKQPSSPLDVLADGQASSGASTDPAPHLSLFAERIGRR